MKKEDHEAKMNENVSRKKTFVQHKTNKQAINAIHY